MRDGGLDSNEEEKVPGASEKREENELRAINEGYKKEEQESQNVANMLK